MIYLKGKYPYEYDVIVVGSGIAGLFAAIKAARFARVCLLTKDALYNTNTWLAQGGIAAALGNDDSPEQHMDDTILAGAGLCNLEAVKVMVGEGPQRIKELLELGMPFDREGNRLAMTREGAHSRNRIVHAGGDATGRIMYETLKYNLFADKAIDVREHTFVTDLVTSEGQVIGVRTLDGETYRAGAVILATGGLGRVFSYTTNPDVATGDGVAMAYRAGAEITDMEFIQFHPTVFQSPEGEIILISEAVRGEGAVLRNCRGHRFMDEYHEMAELGPRDVVARAIVDQLKKEGSRYVFLDATIHDSVFLRNRFPTIYGLILNHGLDPAKDWLPVTPAAHYAMGGVRSGLHGDTNLAGLYACGEVACSGVHGANRLASNSLLEGLVFAGRVVEHIEKTGSELPGSLHQSSKSDYCRKNFSLKPAYIKKLQDEFRTIMFNNVGILRDENGLSEARLFLQQYAQLLDGVPEDRATWELKNLFAAAELIVNSALMRTESRGSHYRVDYPQPDEDWRLRHLCWLGKRSASCQQV
ncbi:MAG: L-aspartate oxidase [Bacillota bacterium]|nr:L-aspartate oxidase [Bacillota bacterium]